MSKAVRTITMNLDSVKSGLACSLCRSGILLHCILDLLDSHGPRWRSCVLRSIQCVPADWDVTGSKNLLSFYKRKNCGAANMPQLTVYIATHGIDDVVNLLPASDLRGTKDARHSWISNSLRMLVSRKNHTVELQNGSHTCLPIGVASVNINPASEARCEWYSTLSSFGT
jgi:hypothetical protein